jgi:hypothetical protein
MKTMSSLRRHDYLRRVGLLLVVVALIAAIVSCAGSGVGPYNLTMAADPEEGGTATDETNESPYQEGAVVTIKAVAFEDYEFYGWTALAGEFADASAAETTFSMPAQDVRVSAQFKRKQLDHFRGYAIDTATMPYIGDVVDLEDDFVSITATVGTGWVMANPVAKTHDGVTTLIANEDHHLMGYTLEGVEPQWWQVTVSNQFESGELIVAGPVGLIVPTQKEEPLYHAAPKGLDYFLGYEIIDPQRVDESVDLEDQFGSDGDVLVTQAKIFLNPVRITHGGKVTPIVNKKAHLIVYQTLIADASSEQHDVLVTNDFGQQQFTVTEQQEGVLVVPSERLSWESMEPPLDHFRCFNPAASTFPNPREVVELKDEFGTFTVTVGLGTTFCNCVEKAVNEVAAWELVPISHPDYHLMLYMLENVEGSGEWVVEVTNQFGEQQLTISGPGGLAVPTRKDPHGDPVGLDYFLVYGITEHPSIDVIVDLTDEFGGGDNNFQVVEDDPPWLFAVPAQITHDGEVTAIVNPDDYLVFYHVRDDDAPPGLVHHEVKLSNLFGQFTVDVLEAGEAYLAVPSEKIN